MQRGGKKPTTTSWVEGWKNDDEGGRFVRCRLVGRDLKTKGGKEQEIGGEEIIIQDGGTGERSEEEERAGGNQIDVYRCEKSPFKC